MRRYLVLTICIGCTILYFLVPTRIVSFEITFYKNFILYGFFMLYAIGVDSKILGNRAMQFLSGISLEIYLSHMFVLWRKFMYNIYLAKTAGFLTFSYAFVLLQGLWHWFLDISSE